MAQRALVLGAQIEGLRGVDKDATRMAAMLEARGFDVDLRLSSAATRAGMLAGYDRLIAASSSEDAAVVYYSGHGGYANLADERRSLQCIVPTDVRDGGADDWRGITAWELSIKQSELTTKTRNVTVILDCCHSAQLSRSDGPLGSITRALPHPIAGGFDRHMAALRAKYGSIFERVDSVSNPHAVRLVACGQRESAYEFPDASGEFRGAFTSELIEILDQIGTTPTSWATIVGVLRARVLRRFVRQRPDVEGPAHRGVFSLTEHPQQHSVPISSVGEKLVIPVGRLTGVSVGDVYRVLPAETVSHEPRCALGEVEVVEVFATAATVHRRSGTTSFLDQVVALPLRKSAARWAVALEGCDPTGEAMRSAIGASPTLRPAQANDTGILATVRLADGAATVEDARGALSSPVPLPDGLDGVLTQLTSLGIAQGIRELEGEHGVAASEVEIELGLVRDGKPSCLPDHGSLFALQDRYYLTISVLGHRTIFVHVLNLSANGKVALLTHFARGGVVLDHRRRSIILGQSQDGAISGVGVHWPEGLPLSGMPALTELIVIVTLISIDVSGLETASVGTMRDGGNALSCALAQLCDGKYRGQSEPPPLDGFLVKRVSILLDSGKLAIRDCEADCQ